MITIYRSAGGVYLYVRGVSLGLVLFLDRGSGAVRPIRCGISDDVGGVVLKRCAWGGVVLDVRVGLDAVLDGRSAGVWFLVLRCLDSCGVRS